jgi:hypothetical protein
MQIASSAMRTCIASASAVECTATVATPISRRRGRRERDLAAVGDQDLVEHRRARLTR